MNHESQRQQQSGTQNLLSHENLIYLPRGISPELLVSQVRNTMPYLFESGAGSTALGHFMPAQVLRGFDDLSAELLTHFEYFRLCLSSHYLTCGAPVPTDVDNQIRFKLWPETLPLEDALQMASLVLESRQWDFRCVSTRFTYGAAETPWQSEVVTGHLGEWFTLSCAAYCALKRYSDPLAKVKCQDIYDAIADEVRRHSEVFGSLWRAKEGLECLKASASIAHNFGDLDRVMDMWKLGFEDPLRLEFYKLAISPFDPNRKLRYLGRLWVAGELYKSTIGGSAMSLENHRHFALRKPRCLRQSSGFLIPIGPFLDDWGRRVARGLMDRNGAPSESTLEVVEALKHGKNRLPPQTVGYGRALRGISEVHPSLPCEGFSRVSQADFERKWSDEALQQMDDIPSRA